jgi:hypothetical protein
MIERWRLVHLGNRCELLRLSWELETMRCYFMRGGHIEAVEELPGLSDDEAIVRAHALFAERKHVFHGFELWDRTRVIIRHPKPVTSKGPAVWPLQKATRRAVASVRSVASSPMPLASQSKG